MTEIQGQMHYSRILKKEFEERVNANSRYSLRAFARDLGISPSRLSEIFNGKQGLSQRSALSICKKLGLSSEEAKLFCTLVEASDARSKRQRLKAQARLSETSADEETGLRQIQEDTFRIISDWYHYAILELVTLEHFKSDTKWIARKLGISPIQAREAVERLVRLELLERRGTKLKSTGVRLTTTHGVPSESIRKFNRQVLEKALQAVSLQGVDERDIGTLTVAINRKDLPELCGWLRKMRREFNALAEEKNKAKRPDAVYCLATQFFRLTTKQGEGNE